MEGPIDRRVSWWRVGEDEPADALCPLRQLRHRLSWMEFLRNVAHDPRRAFDADGSVIPPGSDWEAFGRAVGSNAGLEEITFDFGPDRRREISSDEFEAFFRGISPNRSIRKLCFKGCERLFQGDACRVLVPFFRGNSLECLELCDCDVRECTRSLSSALQEFSSLKEFTCFGCNAGDGEARDLIEALGGHPGLTNLNLVSCCLGRKSAEELAAHLRNPNSKLSNLTLHDAGLENDQAVAALAAALAVNSALCDLSLIEMQDITGVGWRAIFAALQISGCGLQSLNLSYSDMNDGAVASLIGALSSSDVETLDLGLNSLITVAGWQTFFEFLGTASCMLHTLYLIGNDHLNDEAIGFLTNALTTNSSLQILNMTRCDQVTASGWASFAIVLQSAESNLEELHLSPCGHAINDETAVALANSLAGNFTLLGMDLGGNHITDDGWAAFSQVLCSTSGIEGTYGSNHTLQRLTWSDNDRLPEDVRGLLKLNRENSKSQAARLKIIETHFQDGFVGAPPFVDMDLALLPHALAWMGRGGESGEVEGRLYGFLRSMPSLFFDAKYNASL